MPEPIEPEEGVFTSFETEQVVEITSLKNADTLRLTLEQLKVSEVSELLIFRTDAEGGERTQIGQISLLESSELGSGYSPSFTLDSDQVEPGVFLQFVLLTGGGATTATPVVDANGTLTLEFGGDQRIGAVAAASSALDNLLINDAAAIDLTGLTGTLNVEFLVYREAEYNNTVGLYVTDFSDGGIVVDALSGATLRPGDAGYESAALANRLAVNLAGQHGQVSSFSASIEGGGFLGTFLIANDTDPTAGEVYFSHAGENSGGNDHAKQIGSNLFGFEDKAGLGDADFDDVVVGFAVV